MHPKVIFHTSKEPQINAIQGSILFPLPSAGIDQTIQKTPFDDENTSNSEEQTSFFQEDCGALVIERRRVRYVEMEKLLATAQALDFSTDSDDEA